VVPANTHASTAVNFEIFNMESPILEGSPPGYEMERASAATRFATDAPSPAVAFNYDWNRFQFHRYLP